MLASNGGRQCTVGFVGDFSGDGVRGWVSGSHCSAQKFSPDYAPISQGTAHNEPDAVIGREHYDWNGWTCGIYRCRRSDASLYSFYVGVANERGLLFRPAARWTAPQAKPWDWASVDPASPTFRIVGVGDVASGSIYEKVGQSTGWTYGMVMETCVHYSAYPTMVRCGNTGTAAVEDGDSGGPVFQWGGSGDAVILVGITTGIRDGRMFWSTYPQIELDLGAVFSTR